MLTAGWHHFDCPIVDDGDASQIPQILDMQQAQSDRLPGALLVLALVWLGAAAWAAVIAVRYARRKIRRSFAITTLLPLMVVSAAVTFPRCLHACNYAGDVLHFVVARPYYDCAVASFPC